jgi:hypothetical protein
MWSKTRDKNSSKTVKIYPSEKLAETLRQRAQTLDRKPQADIMFVLDCTGSMQG